jgi:predicted nucleotidyltransferase
MNDSTIEQEIQTKLSTIENTYDVNILYACESGSRAWGFASNDSDYDVRFIYAHPKPWYLTIDEKRDVIELPVNNILDIGGWELRKALQLMRKSNAVIFEWLQSPIVYRKDPDFLAHIQHIMGQFFSSRSGAHHYISMAKNAFDHDLQAGQINIKRYFYALRPLFAALWIVQYRTVPPMTFEALRVVITDKAIQHEIDILLQLKQQSHEKALIAPISALNNMLATKLHYCTLCTNDLLKQENTTHLLNELFIKTITREKHGFI